MFLNDSVQQILRDLGKIELNEVVKKIGDIFVAVNVENNQSRILSHESDLINSLISENLRKSKEILKG